MDPVHPLARRVAREAYVAGDRAKKPKGELVLPLDGYVDHGSPFGP